MTINQILSHRWSTSLIKANSSKNPISDILGLEKIGADKGQNSDQNPQFLDRILTEDLDSTKLIPSRGVIYDQ